MLYAGDDSARSFLVRYRDVRIHFYIERRKKRPASRKQSGMCEYVLQSCTLSSGYTMAASWDAMGRKGREDPVQRW
jgi:hypothetical protein